MSHLTINFKSKSLNMPVMLDVLMPQGHGGYKTLYLLHGAGGDHACWTLKTRIADYVEGKNIAVVMPSGIISIYILFSTKKVQMTVKLWITLQNLLLHVDYRIRDFI